MHRTHLSYPLSPLRHLVIIDFLNGGSRPLRSWRHLLGRGSPKPTSWHLPPRANTSPSVDGFLERILAAAFVQFSDGAMAAHMTSNLRVAGLSPGWTAGGFLVSVLAFSSFVLWDCHIFFMISFTCLSQLLCSGF